MSWRASRSNNGLWPVVGMRFMSIGTESSSPTKKRRTDWKRKVREFVEGNHDPKCHDVQRGSIEPPMLMLEAKQPMVDEEDAQQWEEPYAVYMPDPTIDYAYRCCFCERPSRVDGPVHHWCGECKPMEPLKVGCSQKQQPAFLYHRDDCYYSYVTVWTNEQNYKLVYYNLNEADDHAPITVNERDTVWPCRRRMLGPKDVTETRRRAIVKLPGSTFYAWVRTQNGVLEYYNEAYEAYERVSGVVWSLMTTAEPVECRGRNECAQCQGCDAHECMVYDE